MAKQNKTQAVAETVAHVPGLYAGSLPVALAPGVQIDVDLGGLSHDVQLGLISKGLSSVLVTGKPKQVGVRKEHTETSFRDALVKLAEINWAVLLSGRIPGRAVKGSAKGPTVDRKVVAAARALAIPLAKEIVRGEWKEKFADMDKPPRPNFSKDKEAKARLQAVTAELMALPELLERAKAEVHADRARQAELLAMLKNI